jgi:muramoyltetrapeptide carboxypeptidase LdcA involved in peptidoglycan recycling
MLVAASGGEFMCEMLDHVDFDAIAKADPKWFMGFSDNTNLTFLLPTMCDVAAIYGPCVGDFAMRPWHRCLNASLRSIAIENGEVYAASGYHFHQRKKIKDDKHPFANYNATEPNDILYLNADKESRTSFSGRALGGCLDVLAAFPGTNFDRMKSFQAKYGKDGILWMLESCDMTPFDVRRALWRLDHAGWFDKASGFVFGRCSERLDNIEGYSYEDAIMDGLAAYEVPILINCDLGHIPPSMPFIEGALSEVRSKNNRLTLIQQLV